MIVQPDIRFDNVVVHNQFESLVLVVVEVVDFPLDFDLLNDLSMLMYYVDCDNDQSLNFAGHFDFDHDSQVNEMVIVYDDMNQNLSDIHHD